MKNKDHIDHEVQKTLESLDNMERAKTDAFFYSRLQAHIEQSSPQKITNFTFAFSLTAIILLIVLNMISLVLYLRAWNETSSQQYDVTSDLIYDYQLYDLSYYESFEEE